MKDCFLKQSLMAGLKKNAFEISRSLLVDETRVYVVEDDALQLVTIEPIVFNEKSVVVRGLENGLEILSKPVSGAYSGMIVAKIEN